MKGIRVLYICPAQGTGYTFLIASVDRALPPLRLMWLLLIPRMLKVCRGRWRRCRRVWRWTETHSRHGRSTPEFWMYNSNFATHSDIYQQLNENNLLWKNSQSHVRNPAHSYLLPPLDRAFHAVTFLPFLEIRYVLSFILREKQALNENKS